MQKEKVENRIIVDHVYKTFNVYLDKANSIKEKLLFWKRNRQKERKNDYYFANYSNERYLVRI